MTQCSAVHSKDIQYIFTRVKASFEENGTVFISFLAGLTKEYRKGAASEEPLKKERIWVDIRELKEIHATKKMTSLPEGVSTFHLTKEVFQEIVNISSSCPKELYHITPLSSDTGYKKLG
ncbi:hypothetical protein [Jeotgalibacillus proteolyticus]|uniref:Uncharacterized protein n=1 Tax=Jeotgalibacillus proteolyticus TaxID=2082395 RepID=A0A2S5GCX6_9BACL|nr:hypothetical protein [Jeotgalibacillus proteolyticus]PPA70860.1 hypothetical protein C4B60_08715 [Jeotgalibacillus proteolyticus]